MQIKIKFCSMSTNEVASHSDRLSNFPGCNWHVNQSHVCSLLVLYEMVEWFENVLFIYFILYFIVTHKFHNFWVYLISNHFILKFFSYSELVKLNLPRSHTYQRKDVIQSQITYDPYWLSQNLYTDRWIDYTSNIIITC